MILSILLLLYLPISIEADDLPDAQKCWFRCSAKCLNGNRNGDINDCLSNCTAYNNPQLCKLEDRPCWDRCRDLGPQKPIPVTSGFHTEEHNLSSIVEFNEVHGATFYVVQFKQLNAADFSVSQFQVTVQPSFSNFQKPAPMFCDPLSIRVSAVSSDGVSPLSDPYTVNSPQPRVSAKLQLLHMVYLSTPLKNEFYSANGTIEVTFKYEAGAWPLGEKDLDVVPMFHLITCAEPDLSQGVPLPEFTRGTLPNTLVGRLGSDMMYRKCRFVYYAQSISSRRCATQTEIRTPPTQDLQTLAINCDTVEGNPCVRVDVYQAPICGQINDIDYTILKKYIAPGDKYYSLALNVTFDPIVRDNEMPTIYYQAYYGEALPYSRKEEEALAGVNMTRVLGSTTNCLQFDQNGFCLHNTGNSVNVSGIRYDKLYGITFCAVKDPRNLTLPNLTESSRSVRPRANKIYVNLADQANSKTAMIIGIVVGAIALLIFAIIGICCYINRKQKQENKLYQLKLAQLERQKECRYADLPKMHDIWEIERRNLIIFDEFKLGSGAFGAVYLGKLLGKSLAHKDSISPLGVNLMRAENCQVAVKMLPEYADEMSRSDFLREIGLMKILGYHERLVNMIACITESEPLCLIVEYCSDGDLLRFLRDRCKYMMKLDAAGVNYHEPPIDNSYDIEMVITLKQLLMFAVQVSYGLEYLSSKGFVHRDVAARNVLVHGKNACKIGDFGLCRNLYADNSLYKSKGGRLPLKWMSPEAIRHYEFSAQSDVWAFGVLLFEIITLGGSPYPSVSPEEMLPFLENGGRMERPDNCPENFYEVMCECWTVDPRLRPDFSAIRQKLASLLEEITEEYSYLTLDAQKDYYNVQYGDQKPDVIVIPETETITTEPLKKTLDSPTLSIDSLPVDDVGTWSDDNSVKDFKADDVGRRKTASGDTADSVLGVDNSAYKGDSL
ncbi:hypothetical protein V3C99_016349 [Haemonchus contortus]